MKTHIPFLTRFRPFAKCIALVVQAFWLCASILPFSARASNCCGAASEMCEDDGSCEDKRQVKLTYLAPTFPDATPRTWNYTIMSPSYGLIASGTFNSSSAPNLGTACIPFDEKCTVTIIPIQTYLPVTTSVIQDAKYKEQGAGGSGTSAPGGGGNSSIANPQVIVDSTVYVPPVEIVSSTKLLKIEWCPSCGDPGAKEFSEGEDYFEISGAKCSSSTGGACGSNSSVNFRVNLGSHRGKTQELVIRLDSLTPNGSFNPFSPDHVRFPSIVNAFELEMIRWIKWSRRADKFMDEWVSEDINGLTGERKRIRYFGVDGYKSILRGMGIFPMAPRGIDPVTSGPGAFSDFGVATGEPSYSDPLGRLFSFTRAVYNTPDPLFNQREPAANAALTDGVFNTQLNLRKHIDGRWIVAGNGLITVPTSALDDHDDFARGFLRSPILDFVPIVAPDYTPDLDPESNDLPSFDDVYQVVFPATRVAPGYQATHGGVRWDGTGWIPEWSPGTKREPVQGGASYAVDRDSLSVSYSVIPAIGEGESFTPSLPSGSPPAAVGPQVVVEVIPDTNPSDSLLYEIKAYWRSDVTIGENGAYTVPAGGQFARWRVSSPGAQQFRVEEHRTEGVLEQFVEWWQWKQESGSGGSSTVWTMNHGKGSRQDVDILSKPVAAIGDQWVTTRTTRTFDTQGQSFTALCGLNGPGSVLSATSATTTRQGVSANGTLKKLLVSEVHSDGLPGESITTTRSYNSQGKLASMTRSDGYFERYDTVTETNGITWNRTLRPWNSTPASIDGLPANSTAGAVTLSRTVGNDDTVIEVLNGQSMSKTVTTSTDATVQRLNYRPAQPVTRVETKRFSAFEAGPGGISDNSPYRFSVTETYTDDAVESLAGRIAYRETEDGRITIYHHYRYADGVPVGGHLTYEMNYRKNGATLAIDSLIQENSVVAYNSGGREIWRKRCVWGTPGAAPVTDNLVIETITTDYEQTPGGLLSDAGVTAQRINGRLVQTAQFTNGRKTADWDGTGVETQYFNFNSDDLPQTILNVGVGPVPSVPTSFTYDGLGRTKEERVNDILMGATTYDSRGRAVGESRNGRTTIHSYDDVNRKETTTLPGGATIDSLSYLDGSPLSRTGSGTVAEVYSRNLTSGETEVPPPNLMVGGGNPYATGTILEKSYIAGELSSARIVDGFGTTLAEYIPSKSTEGALDGAWRIFSFDTAGRITGESILEHGAVGPVAIRTVVPLVNGAMETVHASPSPDQIRTTNTIFVQDDGWWRQTVNNDGGVTRERVTGLSGGPGIAGLLSESTYSDPKVGTTWTTTETDGVGTVTQKTWSPGATEPLVVTTQAGQTTQVIQPNGIQTTFGYDAFARQNAIYAPYNTTTTVTYDPVFGQVKTTTSSGGAAAETVTSSTSNTYYPGTGLLQSTTTDGKTTYRAYSSRGEISHVWGATYPQKYEYTPAGQLWKLHTFRGENAAFSTNTWPSSPGASDVTEWIYEFGRLKTKNYAQGQPIQYTYDKQGRLKTRIGGRGRVTQYGYDNAGQLISVSYTGADDPTPDATLTYDDKGRTTAIYTAHPVTGYTTIQQSYESFMGPNHTRTDQYAGMSGGWLHSILDNVSAEGRAAYRGHFLEMLGQPTSASPDYYLSFDKFYTYSPASGELANITVHDSVPGTSTVHSASATFDNPSLNNSSRTVIRNAEATQLVAESLPDGIGRLRQQITRREAATFESTTYTYENGRRQAAATIRRNKAGQTASFQWDYGYNGRSEVTSGVKKIGTSVVPGYNFEYEFDAIGNRTKATVNAIDSILTPNKLNQVTARTVPGRIDIRGEVLTALPVTSVGVRAVPEGADPNDYQNYPWLQALPDPRIGNHFYAGVPVNNSAGPVAATATIQPTAGSAEYDLTETRTSLLPAANEAIAHDEDGNTSRDGLREYKWDSENRLVEIVARRDVWPGGVLPAAAKFARIKNLYDYMGRRVQKDVYLPGAGGVGERLAKRTMFTWDDWNMVMEVEQHITAPHETYVGSGVMTIGTERLVTRTYHYGPDLSGSEQGAGGVGGLLSCMLRDDEWSGQSTYMTLLPCYDGNGNIMSYVDAATGEVEQEEEYGPFGENLRPRPNSVKRVPVGWSTKYTDEETGLVAYQLRYYNAELGRWMSRDPIEEEGGTNLYGFLDNSSTGDVDVLGLDAASNCGKMVVIRLMMRKGLTKAEEFWVRSMFQTHHIISRSIFRKYGSKLAQLGIEENALKNLIVLPRSRFAKALVQTERSLHNGFNKVHSAYINSVQKEVVAVLEKWSAGKLSAQSAKVMISGIRNRLRGTLRKGEIKLVQNEANFLPIGKSGLLVVGGTFLAVQEGSAAETYIQRTQTYERELTNYQENQKWALQYTAALTAEHYFPNSWARHLDWLNPLAIVHGAATIGTLYHMPSPPEMPEELRADLEAFDSSE